MQYSLLIPIIVNLKGTNESAVTNVHYDQSERNQFRYDQKPCTEFCAKLKALRRVYGKLPSREDLISQLSDPKDGQQGSWALGTWEALQQRDSCGFCRLVVCALLECRPQGKPDDWIDPGEKIRTLLLPGEQAFRLSYPSFVDVRLAFVAEGDHDAGGPDNARAVKGSRVRPELVRKWLRTCQEKHRLSPGAHRYHPQQAAASAFRKKPRNGLVRFKRIYG